MKKIVILFVNIIHVVSFCAVLLSGVAGILYEIVGHAKFEQILSDFGISKGFERVWIFSAIMLLLLVVTYFIKSKLFSN